MATREEYEQLKAFARIDGALVGLLWIISFACFIGEFTYPALGMVSLLIGVSSIVFATMRLRRFRDNILEGAISFRRALCYSFLTYFYAALLMAAAQFVYFQFIDNGFLMSQYSAIMSRPEVTQMMTAIYGITPKDMDIAMGTIAALRPIEVALQFLTTNLILGTVISIPMAAMVKSNRKKTF